MVSQISVYGDFKIKDTFEDASADALSGDFAEEALDEIEPGGRRWDEVEVKARMACQPGHDIGVLVGRVIVGDQVQIEFGRGVAVDFAEEPNEFLMAVTVHALA